MDASTRADTPPPPVRHPWGHVVLALAVLAAGVGASLLLSSRDRRESAAAAERSFHTAAGTISDQTTLHLSRYSDLLSSFQALHRSIDDPQDAKFGQFLSAKVPQRGYAGHQAVVTQMRATAAPAMAGAHIDPHTLRPDDLGLTSRNDERVRQALQRATDTGRPVMTAPLQAGSQANPHVNVALFAPLYRDGFLPATVAARRDAVVGWAGVVIRAEQFFGDVLMRTSTGIGLEVFDSARKDAERIAVQPRSFTSGDREARLVAVSAPGRLWTLRMQPLPSRAGDHMSATIILVAGVLVSALLALFITSLGGARNRALRLVDKTTEDLQRSEHRFRSLAASSPLGIFGLTADGSCEYANERLCELTGRTMADLQGQGLAEAYHEDDRAALRKAVTGHSDRSSALRLRILLSDGSLRWVKTHAAPLRDEHDRLTGWVGSVEDVTTEVQAQVASQQLSIELAHQARHDHLTGLANRAYFTEQVDDLLETPGVAGVAVLFFDVDRFKVVNDSLGHDAGDRLLMAVADRLRGAVRHGDVAARFGGDEFVVGLVGVTDADQAAEQAQRLLAALNHTMLIDEHEATVTVSIGVALSDGMCDAETLLTRADTAMYRAKAGGKARIEVDRGAVEAPGRDTTLEQERQLRHAIDHGQLRLMYQPIVAVPGAWMTGVEALVRWEHPERGLLRPGDFIPLAEDCGLVLPLGAWVLRAACAQLQSWSPVLGTRPFYVTVNVSARQLADPLFPSVVATALHDFGVDPATMCLEITESALLRDLEAAEQALQELRTIGVRIAIDDFGTGYSSLTHLKLLPIDMLKIDRSFVSELGHNADNTAIVGAVIRLASAMGMTSVAEGVEDAEQAEWLTSLGCELAQGYHFARPQEPHAIQLLISEGASRQDHPVGGVSAPSAAAGV